MNQEQLKKRLTSRWALNIYFWLGFIFIPLVLSLGNHHHDQPNIRAQIFFAIFYSIVIYGNILWLMPRFFKPKNFPVYLLILLLIISLWSIIQVRYDYLFYGCNCQHPLNLETFFTAFFQIFSFIAIFSAAKLFRDLLNKEHAIQELKLQQIETESQRVKTELNFLKDQINPHFLFNTLNTLYSFALDNSPQIPDYILKLSEIMRYMLYESNVPYVSLEREIQYLKNYISLQEIRLSGRGQINLEVEGKIYAQSIAPLMLITFVENSFKHSMSANTKDISIDIFLKLENEKLFFKTVNTYEADEQNTSDTSHGIGLANVKKRLDILYADRYQLEIIPGETNFEVNLTLLLAV